MHTRLSHNLPARTACLHHLHIPHHPPPPITAISRLLQMSEHPKPSSSPSSTVTEDRTPLRVAPPPPICQQTQPFYRRNHHSSSCRIPQLTPILKAFRHWQGQAACRPKNPSPQNHLDTDISPHAEQPPSGYNHEDWDSADDFTSHSLNCRLVSRHSDTLSLSSPQQHPPPGITEHVEETINSIPSHQPRPHWEPNHLLMRMVWTDSSMMRSNCSHLQTKLLFCFSGKS